MLHILHITVETENDDHDCQSTTTLNDVIISLCFTQSNLDT